MFYLDLHSHSVASDDSRATVEQYLKWVRSLRSRGHQIDGVVLTEHRRYDESSDYSALSQTYGVSVLKGAELDTRNGHFLVYGINAALVASLDLADVHMDPRMLVELADKHGAIAIPAHPGRSGIGFAEWLEKGADLPEVQIVEHLNGGNRPEEAEVADRLVNERDYSGIGGSDAHFVSAIARCLTEFSALPRTEGELAEALRAGDCRAVNLEDTGRD
jgi:predicted metal-dependent phosphoesterase TrpH